MGPEHRFLHMGLTSSDIVDTSLAIQMTEALDLILNDLEELLGRAETAGSSVQGTGDGRPLARHPWRADLVRVQTGHLVRGSEPAPGAAARRCAQEIAVGKLSGAMGTFAHQGPDVEEYVCAKLGLDRRPGLQSNRAA